MNLMSPSIKEQEFLRHVHYIQYGSHGSWFIITWQATCDREKVSENFIMTVADHEKMKPIYTDDFTPESVRRAMSAITNKERFSGDNQKESRFWNNMMWAMEDMDLMELMMSPLKVKNLDDVKLNNDLEIVVLPMHMDEYYLKGNTLYLNFLPGSGRCHGRRAH